VGVGDRARRIAGGEGRVMESGRRKEEGRRRTEEGSKGGR